MFHETILCGGTKWRDWCLMGYRVRQESDP